jgi:hypothetical protein
MLAGELLRTTHERYVHKEVSGALFGSNDRSRLDLMIDEGGGQASIVELKYLRQPNTQPAWPMTLGNVLSDTYRLGALAANEPHGRPNQPKWRINQALQLIVSDTAFLQYLRRQEFTFAHYQHGETTPHRLDLTPDTTRHLSATAVGPLSGRERSWGVAGIRVAEHTLATKGLWLAVYNVRGQRLQH